jgi:hypothetical protein
MVVSLLAVLCTLACIILAARLIRAGWKTEGDEIVADH